MVPVSEQLYLQPALDRLRLAVLEQNKPGSVEGLLAYHILRDDSRIAIDWQIKCTTEWIEKEFKPTNLDHVAALGYSVSDGGQLEFAENLLDGLSRVRDRDAFKGEHLSLARSPSRLLGVLLGSLAFEDQAPEALAWCRAVLTKMKQKQEIGPDPLVSYLYFLAFGDKAKPVAPAEASLYETAFLDWMIRHQMCAGEVTEKQLNSSRANILFAAATDLRFESPSQAAFIWTGVTSSLFCALTSASLQPNHVVAVLENFEAAMRRWRWDLDTLRTPIKWQITQEREIQDILWLILRSYFPDVVDEDTLPKLGHSTYRADFGIVFLKLIIEAKYATSRDDFKKIEKEVQEDCVPYLRDLRYESIIVFIYDESSSVQEHDTTRRALLEIPGVVGVVIASRPSQLPARQPTSRKPARPS
jgi:hypothetical protein